MTTLVRLGEALASAGVGYTGLAVLNAGTPEDPAWFVVPGPLGERVRLDGVPTAHEAAATAVVLGFDFSQSAHDLWLAARARAEDAAGLDAPTGAPRVLRATVSLTVDELNDLRAAVNGLRTWITQFKSATASATSLADFKARVAALADMPANLPARTLQQARTAIVNKVEAGQVDG
jgi:hypothetical protein